MARQVQIRRGTTSQHSTFTGAVGELSVDTDKDVVVVHDGSTAGGFPLARQLSDLGVTSTSAELNILDGATLTTAELNYVDGVTSAIQTQLDAKGTVSTLSDLSITATATELNYVSGVTSAIQTQLDAKGTVSSLSDLSITATAAELNVLDGFTGALADVNRLDVTTEGLTEASKVVTADSNGVVSFDNGTIEEVTTITSSANAATINLRDGNVFEHDLTENVTYTFSNPAASGRASCFILKVIQGATARTITWPASVDWNAAAAPTLTATNDGVDVFGFITIDGGITYYGFVLGQAMG